MASRASARVAWEIGRTFAAPAARISVGAGGVVAPPLADGSQEALQGGDQAALHLHVAHLPLAVAGLEFLHLRPVVVEDLVVTEDHVVGRVGVRRDVRPDADRVGEHLHDLAGHLLRRVAEEDGVAQGFAHLGPAVDPGQGGHVADEGLGLREDLPSVKGVEAPRDLPAQFDVGLLVLPHRDDLGLHVEDIGRLEDGVEHQPQRRVLDLLIPDHVLKGRDALDPRQGDQHGEQQGQFADLRDVGLQVDGGLLGVDAHRQVIQDDLSDVFAGGQDVRLLRLGGQGVVVGDEQEDLVFVLQPHPVGQGAHVVAQVQGPRGPISGQHPFFGPHGAPPLAPDPETTGPVPKGTGPVRARGATLLGHDPLRGGRPHSFARAPPTP